MADHQNYNMFPTPTRPATDADFMLFPDTNGAHTGYVSPPLDVQYSPDSFNHYARHPADNFPHSAAGYEAGAMYAEAPHFVFAGRTSPNAYHEERELRVPSSNLSVASGASPTSSTAGSPHSHHGQLAFVPEFAQNPLGVHPGIVGQNDYFTGSEYSGFPAPGMEEFNMTYEAKPGFVGESARISKDCVPRSASSSSDFLSSSSTRGLALNTNLAHLAAVPESTPVSSLQVSSVSPGNGWSSPSTAAETSPATPARVSFFSQSSGHFVPPLGLGLSSCRFLSSVKSVDFLRTSADAMPVDPSLIHPEIRGQMGPPMPGFDNYSPQNAYPHSPALSGASSPAPPNMRPGNSSPYIPAPAYQYSQFAAPPQGRRPSLSSFQSQEYPYSGDESKERQRCPHPDCGKIFKDLKAHMLTHQNERPEKCPIATCDYHVKGFARKYDKNRHTLTHYKGTMVCGFCPGSGSAAEKSFNRADVFKRHLTAVHGVEQTPPNSRKKTNGSVNSGKKLTGYAPDATGKCSTCTATFSNAQDFYEHLDDCVLRIVQQEDPAEAVNARRLAEVENDGDVHQTLEKNSLPLTTQTTSASDDEDEDDMDDEDDEDNIKTARKVTKNKRTNPANGVQKSRGMTHSRGGVSLPTKGKSRKNRRDYPSSWGFDKGQMTMKKRVMTVFDGQRRLAKDDMMLSTEHEVRVKLADGASYVTDLDVQTMKRAQGFLDATDEEKGVWISDDPTEDDIKRMFDMSHR
jgi:hypothetical protein